jgi:hypothetical protein
MNTMATKPMMRGMYTTAFASSSALAVVWSRTLSTVRTTVLVAYVAQSSLDEGVGEESVIAQPA